MVTRGRHARWQRDEMGGKPEPSHMFWNFVGAWRDAGVAVVQAVVEGHGWRVGGLVNPFGHRWEIGLQI